MPTRCNKCFFIADLIAYSTCFGHNYAHHQELESIIQVVACHIWCFGFQVVGMVWSWGLCVRFAGCTLCSTPYCTLCSTPYRQLENQAPNTTGSNHFCNSLELLMMGIIVPETCWVNNKICNKNHLLHLVGILFPHINDDARSKPHQIVMFYLWGPGRRRIEGVKIKLHTFLTSKVCGGC